jgi:hypothetical protein
MTEPVANEPRSAEPAVTSMTPEQEAMTDAVILSCATSVSCKVAILIARTVDAAKAKSLDVTPAMIAPRIYALAESGKLNVQGNVRRWRAAEVKKGI